MRRIAWHLAAWVGLGLAAAACSEGDDHAVILPLQPCVQDVDAAWRAARPLWGRRLPTAMVWSRSDLAVIVGQQGLAMVWEGGGWHLEDTGAKRTFRAVAGGSDRSVCAVGDGGVVATRTAAGWSARRVAGGADLVRVHADGSRFWAAGRAGAVVAVDGADASVLPAPTSRDIQDVFVRGDTLWALDGADTLRVWTGGAWSASCPPRLAGKSLRSCATLPDGRLVVLADSLYVRDADRWWCPPFVPGWYQWEQAPGRLEADATGVWVLLTYSGCKGGHFTLENGAWSPSGLCMELLAPRGVRTYLSLNHDDLVWVRDGDPERDPVASSERCRLVRLSDGTACVFSDAFWLENVGPEGVRPSTTWADSPVHFPRSAAGSTLDDVFATDYRDRVVRVTDGTVEVVAEIATDRDIAHLTLLADGTLLIFESHGRVFSWRDGRVDTAFAPVDDYAVPVASGPDYEVVLLGSSDDPWRLDADGVSHIPVQRGFEEAGFLPDGRLVMLCWNPVVEGEYVGPDRWLVVRDPAGGRLRSYPAPLPLSCPEIEIGGATWAASGFYVWTAHAPVVFRVAGDPAAHDWELVAGPLDREIDDLVVQPDGSLVVVADEKIYWHPGAGP